jgi:hypothetical protein
MNTPCTAVLWSCCCAQDRTGRMNRQDGTLERDRWRIMAHLGNWVSLSHRC